VADVSAEFSVSIDDGISGTAEQAAQALDRLKGAIDRDKKALAQMQSAMRDLKSGSVMNIQAFRELQGRIDAQKQKIAEAQQRYVALGGTFEKTAAKGKQGFKALLDEAKNAPGILGQAAQGLSSLTANAPSVLAAAGVLALVAGTAALAVATVTATAALLRYGLAQAEARRNELGRLEGLTLMRTRYRQAAGSAQELQAAIDRVSGSSSTGRAELEGMTERLYRMGYRGAALERALEGMTTATEVLGERGGNRFLAMAAHARRTGQSVDALADRIQARLGPAAARKALSWDSQMARLGRNFGQIFGGLNIDPLLASLKRVTDIFSMNQASGRALKQLFETIFQPFINQATQSGPIVETVILRSIIGVQRLTIFALRLRNAWLRAFGTEVVDGIDTVNVRAIALQGVTSALTFDIMGALNAFTRLRAIARGEEILPRVDAGGIGKQGRSAGNAVNEGLIQGIRGGQGAFPNAMRDIARQGMQAFRDELGIRSPSRVFAGLGLMIPAGIAQGVERGTPEVAHAVEHMVSVPDAPSMEAVTAASPAGTRAGGGDTIHVHVGDIIVQGAESPMETAQTISDEIATRLEAALIFRRGGSRA
jgi:hypothetical protein